ncbi:MAG: CvpA family protein [Actinomycetota bacterium]
MTDFVLGAILAVLALSGWRRGLLRGALDFAGLVIGTLAAFRFARPVGNYLTDRFGVGPEWATVGSALGMFVGIGLLLGILARALSAVVGLPGLNLANRIGGALLAVAWGAVLLTVLVAVTGILPIGGFKSSLTESRVVQVVAGPESLTSRALEQVSGSRSVGHAIAALERLVGERRVVVDGLERVQIAPVPESELTLDPISAQELLELVNATRLAAGASPLPFAADLASIATSHAVEMYRDGYMSSNSPVTGSPQDRVAGAGIHLAVVEENIALASNTRAVHEALDNSASHRARMLSATVDRVGIGVVAGPYGLMVVEVFGG